MSNNKVPPAVPLTDPVTPPWTQWEYFKMMTKSTFGEVDQKLGEKKFIKFFKYQRKREATVQEYTANFDRLYIEASEQPNNKGLKLGTVASSFWYLWMGHFTDEQKRWILAHNVQNAYTKCKEIVGHACDMPDCRRGYAHFVEFEDEAAPALHSA